MRLTALSVSTAVMLATAAPVAAGGLADFGRCLARQGAVFYGASWCPHCRSQRETLGDAMTAVRYVECSPDGGRSGSAPPCVDAQVDAFPTWLFSDGSRAEGELSLAQLASRTGCSLPSAQNGTGDSPSAGSDGTNVQRPGPKIIEVPPE